VANSHFINLTCERFLGRASLSHFINPTYKRFLGRASLSHLINPTYKRSHFINPTYKRSHFINPTYKRSHFINPTYERSHFLTPLNKRSPVTQYKSITILSAPMICYTSIDRIACVTIFRIGSTFFLPLKELRSLVGIAFSCYIVFGQSLY